MQFELQRSVDNYSYHVQDNSTHVRYLFGLDHTQHQRAFHERLEILAAQHVYYNRVRIRLDDSHSGLKL